MGKFLLRLIISAVAIWLTSSILEGVHMKPYSEDNGLSVAVSYLVVALIFALVNTVVGSIVRVVAFPVYILTLGLISFIVNGLLLLLVAKIGELMGFGLQIDGFWWAVLGAIVISLINAVLSAITRPQLSRR